MRSLAVCLLIRARPHLSFESTEGGTRWSQPKGLAVLRLEGF